VISHIWVDALLLEWKTLTEHHAVQLVKCILEFLVIGHAVFACVMYDFSLAAHASYASHGKLKVFDCL
jgi:hypothetical protein